MRSALYLIIFVRVFFVIKFGFQLNETWQLLLGYSENRYHDICQFFYTSAYPIYTKIYPKKCVNLCMLGPLKDANLGIKPPEFLKYAHYLPKIPSLPKATQMSLKLH